MGIGYEPDLAIMLKGFEATMPHALDRISAEDTQLLMRKRARWNVVIALSLAAFVGVVFVVSFAHIQSEESRAAPVQRPISE